MSHRRMPHGFTLLEVLLALCITALVCTGVMGMLYAMAQGTKNDFENRNIILTAAVIRARINAPLRSADTLLTSTSSRLVLWNGDSRNNGQVNISELVRIEYLPASSQLCVYQSPAGLPESSDTAFDSASTDFNAVTQTLIASGVLQPTVLASDVSDTSFTTIATSTRTLIEYTIQIRDPMATIAGCESLRGNN